MNRIQRFNWWLSGQVVKIVEEEYGDVGDAIGMPVFASVVSALLWNATIQLAIQGGTAEQIASVGAGFIALVTTYHLLFLIGASYVYYTQNTETDVRMDVV